MLASGPAGAQPRALATATGLATGLLALGYALLWCSLDALPIQDIPNHLSRAIVMGDLLFDGGVRFGEVYAFEWRAIPYILGDALLLPLARAFPPDVAGRLWILLTWASLPAALLVLLRAWRVPALATTTALAFALYLATDAFFMMGFANFRLGVALVLLGLAAWEYAQRDGASPWPWAAFFAAAAAGYLMHLSALLFLVAAVGTLSLVRLLERRAPLDRLLLAGLPIVALLAWHVLLRDPDAGGVAIQPDAARKLLRFGSSLVRYHGALEVGIVVAFVGSSVAAIGGWLRGRIESLELELVLLAVAFFALYLVMPEQRAAIWAIDNRALSFAWLFVALAAVLSVRRSRPAAGALAAVAVLVATANLGFLAAQLLPENRVMRDYRALAAELPRGAVVLPVLTRPKPGYTNPFAHAGSWATIEADAVVPYTFSANEGHPMRYFRFRERPHAPWAFWYQHDFAPDTWEGVLEQYDYVLVGVPVEWERLPVPMRVERRNAVAALVRPDDPRGTRTASTADAP